MTKGRIALFITTRFARNPVILTIHDVARRKYACHSKRPRRFPAHRCYLVSRPPRLPVACPTVCPTVRPASNRKRDDGICCSAARTPHPGSKRGDRQVTLSWASFKSPVVYWNPFDIPSVSVSPMQAGSFNAVAGIRPAAANQLQQPRSYSCSD